MPTEAQVLAIDRVPDKQGGKLCTNCGHPKTLDEFARNRSRQDGHSAQCLLCLRIARTERYHEGGGKEAQVAYYARPEVQASRREYDRGRRNRRMASRRAYNTTLRARIAKCRCNARRKFREAMTDERRAELETLIAAYDREIARLDARKAAVREAELPALPPTPRVRESTRSPARGIYLTPAGTFEVKISVGKSKSVRGGTYATLAEARDAANALAFRLRGVRNYATPREERRRA
jgi:hypothetical protein